jgi:O-antigen ligase
MPYTSARKLGKVIPAREPVTTAGPWKILTQCAFFLSLVLVIARMTMQEFLRGSALPVPGSQAAATTAGPATSLLLDLLFCLPAGLVLLRRVVDPRFALRLSWSHLAMFLLAGWTLASVFWSSDKFAAIINASHWAAALMLLWSTSQLVHSWLRLRLIAAVGFGLLMVLLVQGYYYRFVDLPELQAEWQKHHTEMLHQQGTELNSTEADQIGKNVASGEVSGFNISRNTYAAVLVLLIVLSGGIVMQRLKDEDSPGWILPVVVVIVFALVMLYVWVKSKTAFATPVIGAILLTLIWFRGKQISLHFRRLYWAALACGLAAIAAVVGHGLYHGTLVHVSLTFRWWYWVGAARVFLHHPLLGVGWSNFGAHYLAYRLPQAAEEPSDPHNFIVRSFVELGVIGGALTVAWMLRLWWELTVAGANPEPGPQAIERSDLNKGKSAYAGTPALSFLLAVAVGAIALNCLVSIDWTISSAWVTLEVFKRLLFLLALVTGICVVAIRSTDRQELDDRPAPWLLAAMLVALALFLLHNLIDFSMFETGPMFLFALLAGAVLGIRLPKGRQSTTGQRAAIIGLILGGIGWLIAAAAGLLPVVRAEELAQSADTDIRAAGSAEGPSATPTDLAKLERAEKTLSDAFAIVPINADYAFRAEQAALLARKEPRHLQRLLHQARESNPISSRYLLAQAALSTASGDLGQANADYERILQLDPNNLEVRLQYARLLDQQGKHVEAKAQYGKTLDLNSKLASDEIRRLSPNQLEQIHKWMAL